VTRAKPPVTVSRETKERLDIYLALLRKWSPKINLVARGTLEDAWTRHIIDSAQLLPLVMPATQRLADLGSGAGFPGLVIAIIATETRPNLNVTLVESDQRKATFLRTVARETSVAVQIRAERIEKGPDLAAQTITARALAPLPRLLDLAARHLAPGGQMLFLKGQTWATELSEAQAEWTFSYTPHKSKTSTDAVILEIRDLSHV
jgi:16S rRNA (guanine527-N7)-methyltransferase